MQKISIGDLIGTAQMLTASGRAALAASLYRDWTRQNPDDPLLHAVWFNFGVLLSDLGDLPGAVQAFGEAIRHNPGFLPAYVNLGSAHERLGAPELALAHWSHVTGSLAGVTGETVTYKVTALKQTAQLLESRKLLAEAEDALRQIIELTPQQRDVVQHWISLRQRQCCWPLLAPVGSLDRTQLLRLMAPLSLANYTDDPLLQLAGAWRYTREDIGAPEAPRSGALPADWSAPRRLRIGYLSSDLRDHAIGHLTADMFRLHDRGQFEIFVYDCGLDTEDATRRRIRDTVEHWTRITELDDDAALARMLADGIDILVDVNGHTRGARTRLLALRPAPVIINWLGFPGSMGSPYHHYIIADPHIIPPGSEIYYSEKVLRLPCYQPNDRNRHVAPQAPTREAAGLPADAVVYCSFNGTQKITPGVFVSWMEILRQVPDGVLWLLKGSNEVDTRLRALAAAAGIAPDRLIFAPLQQNAEHVARYALADLFLDTTPYGAHTTASDALWMGVPVLTLPGRAFASRVCASLVQAAGLPELVCASAEEYRARAVALGQDRPLLAALRARLLAGRDTSLLFDTPQFVQGLEALFQQIRADVAAAGGPPSPDLTNLDSYLEIGVRLDHDSAIPGSLPDYADRYRQALARRHAFAPLPWDRRLWQAPA